MRKTEGTYLLNVGTLGNSGLNVKETRYLFDLVSVFKGRELSQSFQELWVDIENESDPIVRIQRIDDFLQDVEDYREQNLNWKKDDRLRMSIISKLKSFDVDFDRYFESLLK